LVYAKPINAKAAFIQQTGNVECLAICAHSREGWGDVYRYGGKAVNAAMRQVLNVVRERLTAEDWVDGELNSTRQAEKSRPASKPSGAEDLFQAECLAVFLYQEYCQPDVIQQLLEHIA
jgi:hypothetical protein